MNGLEIVIIAVYSPFQLRSCNNPTGRLLSRIVVDYGARRMGIRGK